MMISIRKPGPYGVFLRLSSFWAMRALYLNGYHVKAELIRAYRDKEDDL